MIEEHILSAKFRQFVTAAIHKILRDLSKNVGAPEEGSNAGSGGTSKPAPPAVPPRVVQNNSLAHSNVNILPQLTQSQQSQQQVKNSPVNDLTASMVNLSAISTSSSNSSNNLVYKDKIVHQPSGLASTTKKTYGPEGITYDFEPMTRDYPNDFPIEDFVLDVASNCNRDADKANEWLSKLKNQDIMTVGDLRDLLDDDWAHLNLTVFASRALKNGLQSTTRKVPSSLSPRMSIVSNSSGSTNATNGTGNPNNSSSVPIPPNNPSASHGISNGSTPPTNTVQIASQVSQASIPVPVGNQAPAPQQLSPTISSDHEQPPYSLQH